MYFWNYRILATIRMLAGTSLINFALCVYRKAYSFPLREHGHLKSLAKSSFCRLWMNFSFSSLLLAGFDRGISSGECCNVLYPYLVKNEYYIPLECSSSLDVAYYVSVGIYKQFIFAFLPKHDSNVNAELFYVHLNQ